MYPIVFFKDWIVRYHFMHSTKVARVLFLKWPLHFLWYLLQNIKNTKYIEMSNGSCHVLLLVWSALFLQLFMNCGNTTSFGMWLRTRKLCYLTWMEGMLVCLFLRIIPWTVASRNRMSVDHRRKVSLCSHSLNAPS